MAPFSLAGTIVRLTGPVNGFFRAVRARLTGSPGGAYPRLLPRGFEARVSHTTSEKPDRLQAARERLAFAVQQLEDSAASAARAGADTPADVAAEIDAMRAEIAAHREAREDAARRLDAVIERVRAVLRA